MDRRNIVLITVFALAVIGGLVYWKARPQPTPSPTTAFGATTREKERSTDVQPPVAFISEIDGEATVVRGESSSTARLHMELKEGDAIIVAEKGRVAITWPEYGRTMADGGSSFVIRRAQSNADASSFLVNIKLNVGRIWTRLERLLGPKEAFEVRASTVVATVRGTSYGVDARGPRVRVLVTEHRVKVRQVSDREATEEERARGISDLDLEVFPGLESVVGEREEVDIDPVRGTSMESMFQPRALPADALEDPFIINADTPIPIEELRVPSEGDRSFDASAFPTSIGNIDMNTWIRFAQEMADRYPNGDVPPSVLVEFYRSQGIPITEAMLNAQDSSAYMQALQQQAAAAGTVE
ncbi:MAG TPA: FecR domain-containing protein [Candidatus Methylomirabilis sp.]|nr:FecR domain-containing protein [Candidatus Methylomirabilis sp.]